MDDATAARTAVVQSVVVVPVPAFEIAEMFGRGWTITVAIPIACPGFVLVAGAISWTVRNDPPK